MNNEQNHIVYIEILKFHIDNNKILGGWPKGVHSFIGIINSSVIFLI